MGYPGGAMRVDIVGGTNTVYYMLSDHLGSASVLLKSDGTIEANGEQRYYPFGESRIASADLKTAHLFTGQIDTGLGIYHFGARFYSQKLGRFISADAIVPDFANPQGLNRYSYVLNSPLKYVDPTGNVPDPACAGEPDCGVDGWYGPSPEIWTEEELAWARQDAEWWLEAGKLIASIFAEPVDWAVTAGDCLSGNCSPVALLGLLPLIPAAVANRVDDVGDAARLANSVCSFSADTPVVTDEGEQEISELQEGDYVLAYDEASGKTGYYPVLAVLVHDDPVIEYLTIDGEQIETTPEHPFYTEEQGWVPAGELWIGAHVRQADGDYGIVQAVELERRSRTMYNLTVADAHTFFVGVGQWLVHNECDRGLLRRNLGITDRDYQAHHLIPCEFCNEPGVKAGIKGGFEFNGAENGIGLPNNLARSIEDDIPYHFGDHEFYSDELVWPAIGGLNRLVGEGLSDELAADMLQVIASDLNGKIRRLGGGIRLP